jgi:hypothetical protein
MKKFTLNVDGSLDVVEAVVQPLLDDAGQPKKDAAGAVLTVENKTAWYFTRDSVRQAALGFPDMPADIRAAIDALP